MPQFDLDKIVQYLAPYRDRLHELYNWNADLSKLIDMQIVVSRTIALTIGKYKDIEKWNYIPSERIDSLRVVEHKK